MRQGVPSSVLIVEELAHLDRGHFPVRCVQLADAYSALDIGVEILTSEGWSREPHVERSSVAIRRYSPVGRTISRVTREWKGRRGLWGHVARTAVLVAETRFRARKMYPRPAAIIVLAWDADPTLLSVFAGRGRWLVNAFRGPDEMPQIRQPAAARVLASVGRRRESSRRAHDSCVRLSVADPARRERWAEVLPFADPTTMAIAGARDVRKHPEARARLGLPHETKIALLFGSSFQKRPGVVMNAFDHLADWTLVLGGEVANGHDHQPSFPGVVTDETRDLLFSVADLVVLSFSPGYRNNSGTLMDAISFGIPVVCSDDAEVAEQIVQRYRIGALFDGDSSESLIAAVRRTEHETEPASLITAQRELSNVAVVRCQLEALHLAAPD